MDLAAYRRLRTEARRHARRAADADDLVQDALLIALEQGRGDDPAWLAGVIRNQAAMQARSAIRRRRREATVAEDDVAPAQEEAPPSACALLERLPPAARRVAVLALHGLNAEEIRWVLGIAETAFRQRLTRIRKALCALPPAQRAEAIALAYVRDPARSADLQFGLVRRALKAALQGGAGIGTHDADGHLLVVRGRAHGSPAGGNEST
ncbi:RNA polymerase sigma factor [Lysobacter hankyongensis]|uniref:RNA polymerase sigma-70 region 2 domain-containing protein n=1 Tax=Lysobacter hankyongensis TaxID=1176535 RepID=A0ABP9ASE4_9GAMM